MLAITLTPASLCVLAAFAVLAAPRGARAPIMATAAAAAMYLMLNRDFGSTPAIAQMGLSVVLLNLDA